MNTRNFTATRLAITVSALVIAGAVAAPQALASQIHITPNASDGTLSHINTNGTNWGGTTFFNVANLATPGFGSYHHEKVDGGPMAAAYVDLDLTHPTAETATFSVTKTGTANAANNSWSSAQGFVYFSLDSDATFTLDTSLLGSEETRFLWHIALYDGGSDSYGNLFANTPNTSAVIASDGVSTFAGAGSHSYAQATGALGAGQYAFYWATRNTLYTQNGTFNQSFELNLTAEPANRVAEPTPFALSLMALVAMLGMRRKQRS